MWLSLALDPAGGGHYVIAVGSEKISAAVASMALGVVWVLFALITKFQLTFLAIVFGGIISGVVTWYSGGRGFLYQGIATLFTIAGILVADVIVVRIFWSDLYPNWTGTLPPFMALLEHMATNDPATLLFCTLGVMGGCFIWHEGTGGAE